jgi:hypothetical protein
MLPLKIRTLNLKSTPHKVAAEKKQLFTRKKERIEALNNTIPKL